MKSTLSFPSQRLPPIIIPSIPSTGQTSNIRPITSNIRPISRDNENQPINYGRNPFVFESRSTISQTEYHPSPKMIDSSPPATRMIIGTSLTTNQRETVSPLEGNETRSNFEPIPIRNEDLANLELSISSHLPAILEAVEREDYLLLSAATGTGKSLGLPWALAHQGYRVLISVPTVTAAESLARQQDLLLHKNSGQSQNISVGYAAEARIHYSEESQIIYATSGHVRRRFLDYYRHRDPKSSEKRGFLDNHITRLMDNIDIIILDEIHHGSIDDDVNHALWKYGQNRLGQVGSSHHENGDQRHRLKLPKLIMVSATPEESRYPGILHYSISTKSYPVETYYHYKNYSLSDKSWLPDLVTLISEFHESPLNGDILVFVAGKNEINQIIHRLQQRLNIFKESDQKGNSKDLRNGRKAVLLPAHSHLSAKELERIYLRPDFSRQAGRMVESIYTTETIKPPRKIIIATNIAETSITIPNINIVIDSMREKRSETSTTGGFRLSTHYISQASAIQRCGRTGRTGPGICYRLCTANFFLKLEKDRPREIFRVPIFNTVMELMEVGLRPENVLSQMDTRKIERSLSLLNQLQLIDTDRRVSEAGHFVTNFPLSVRNATTLWHWIQQGYPPYPGIVTISLIDSYGPSYFWFPSQGPGQSNSEYRTMILAHREKYFIPMEGYSDVDTLLNMWNKFTSEVGGPKANKNLVRDWAVSNSINNRKLKEALRIIHQVENTLERLGISVTVGPFTQEGVVRAIRPLFETTYFDQIMTWTKGSQPSYYHSDSKQVYRLDQRNAVNRLTESLPSRIVSLATAEIGVGGGVIRLIGMALDLPDITVGTGQISEEQENNLSRALASLRGTHVGTPLRFQPRVITEES